MNTQSENNIKTIAGRLQLLIATSLFAYILLGPGQKCMKSLTAQNSYDNDHAYTDNADARIGSHAVVIANCIASPKKEVFDVALNHLLSENYTELSAMKLRGDIVDLPIHSKVVVIDRTILGRAKIYLTDSPSQSYWLMADWLTPSDSTEIPNVSRPSQQILPRDDYRPKGTLRDDCIVTTSRSCIEDALKGDRETLRERIWPHCLVDLPAGTKVYILSGNIMGMAWIRLIDSGDEYWTTSDCIWHD